MKRIIILFTITLAVSSFVIATEEKESSKSTAMAEHKIFASSELKWADAPPGLPSGGKMAVLDGDPNKKGSFTVRLQAPDGYKVPPHTHPSAENITVISGTLHLGMGDKFDESATHKMIAGSFTAMPAGMKHFVRTSGETVVQIHSEGPFEIKYVNPADDPRNTKK